MMKQITTFVAGLVLAWSVLATPAFAHDMNPCNPCSMHQKMNPCNPCGMMHKMNPCGMKHKMNPCGMKHDMNPCNPCSMKGHH